MLLWCICSFFLVKVGVGVDQDEKWGFWYVACDFVFSFPKVEPSLGNLFFFPRSKVSGDRLRLLVLETITVFILPGFVSRLRKIKS